MAGLSKAMTRPSHLRLPALHPCSDARVGQPVHGGWVYEV